MNNKNIEEQIQNILLTLVEFDGNKEKGFAASVSVSTAQRKLTNLLQVEKEEYLDEFVKGCRSNNPDLEVWFFNMEAVEQFKRENKDDEGKKLAKELRKLNL